MRYLRIVYMLVYFFIRTVIIIFLNAVGSPGVKLCINGKGREPSHRTAST